jgi:hypothetical protein
MFLPRFSPLIPGKLEEELPHINSYVSLFSRVIAQESSKNKFPIYLERIIVWHVET